MCFLVSYYITINYSLMVLIVTMLVTTITTIYDLTIRVLQFMFIYKLQSVKYIDRELSTIMAGGGWGQIQIFCDGKNVTSTYCKQDLTANWVML